MTQPSAAPRFALVGAAGFVAPRHLRAIRDVGGELVAACDPHDSVGILDEHFPGAQFFTEIERFDRHLELLRRRGEGVDYVSVCSPNYLHDAHCRLALRGGASAICEKPLVLSPWNLDQLVEIERETGQRVFTVLQLRLLPALRSLREVLAKSDRTHDVDLRYVTRRGAWYHSSWKGSEERSGGLAMNVGVHFFDLLLWLFGAAKDVRVRERTPSRVSGSLELERAFVRWHLSVDEADLPADVRARGGHAYRSLVLDGHELEFSDGFRDLHSRVYEEVLAGRGLGVEDARPAIELVHQVRCATLQPTSFAPSPSKTSQAPSCAGVPATVSAPDASS